MLNRDKMVETGMGTVVSVLEKLGAESMSIDIEKQEVAFTLNDSKYLYKVNVNVLSKELWKTYYSADWFKEYTEELDTLAYNINKGIVDNPKIIEQREQREQYKIKNKELKIRQESVFAVLIASALIQEPGIAVLIASALILVGYLIGVSV